MNLFTKILGLLVAAGRGAAGNAEPVVPGQGRMQGARWGVALLVLASSVLLSPVQAQVQRSIINPSFEVPALGGNACYGFTASASVPGWISTDTGSSGGGTCTGQVTGANPIEIWRTNFQSFTAFDGNQHVELNATVAGRISQNICLQSGDVVKWAYSHRARGSGVESATFSLGGPTITVNTAKTNSLGVVSSVSTDCKNTSPITNASCSNSTQSSWGRYTGTFTWQGSPGSNAIGFEAVDAGSVGNFLDDVQFTLKPFMEFSSATVSVPESAGTANFQLRVAGIVSAATAVPFTITGTATGGGVDYTLANSFTVPAGDYGAGTAINVPITLVNDSVPEGTETVIITLNDPGAGASYRLGSTVACGGTAIGIVTLSITDDDVSVTLNKTLVPASDSGKFNLSVTGGTPAPSGGTNPAGNQGNGGSTGAVKVAPSSVITLAETAGTSTLLSNYTTALSCVDGSGTSVPVTGSGTSRTITTPALTASAAARTITCTYTNTAPHATIALKKALAGERLAVSDQFSVAIRTGGVSGTVVNSTTNSTTLGSGATVTAGSGDTGAYKGAVGTAYTLNEAMAAGSTSRLTQYIRTLSCTNIGGTTDVTGFASLPLTFSPVNGDNVSCTITNKPPGPVVAGRVFLDNGASGGVANDGLINGGETGLAGIKVQLTNCAATLYASGITDGAGAYSLAVPAGTATGAALCVEQTNLGGRLSTGASVGSTAIPSASATVVGSTSYSYTRPGIPDKLAFAWNGVGHANLNFGDVNPNSFTGDGAKTGIQGTNVNYPHTFTAQTAGSVSFSVVDSVATPVIAGWSEKIYADAGCSGTLQPSAVLLFPPALATPVSAAGQKVCIILQEFVPLATSDGYTNTATVQASFIYSNAGPALTARYTLKDTTTLSASVLDLRKEVRNVTSGGVFGISNLAKSGETLEYRITYSNNSTEPLTNVLIADATPAFTKFVNATDSGTPASMLVCTKTTPAGTASCATSQAPGGGTGAITFTFTGSLQPSASAAVLFQVRVD